MNVLYRNSGTNVMMELSLTEFKVLYCMLQLAKNNVVDMNKIGVNISSISGLSSKSVSNAMTSLVKRKILEKTQLSKIYFISPMYYMVGDSNKIYSLSKMVEERSKGLLEKIESYDNAERKNYSTVRLKPVTDKFLF